MLNRRNSCRWGSTSNGNKGFEGSPTIRRASALRRQERNPVRIYEISGFPFAEPTPSVYQ